MTPAAFLTLIPVWLAGDLLLQKVAPLPSYGWWLRWPAAFVLGSLLATLTLFYVSLVVTSMALTATVVVVFICAIWHLWRQRQRVATVSPRQAAAAAVPLALGLLIAATSAQVGLGHDGIRFWAFKAQIIFSEGGWPNISETSSWIPHVAYPILFPVMQAWVYKLLGAVDTQAGKVVVIFSYVGLICAYYALTRRHLVRPLAVLFTLLLAITPYLASISALSGYAELPLMLPLFLGVALIASWMKTEDVTLLRLGGIMLAAATWVKREGLVYWAITFCLLLLFVLFWKRRHSHRERIQPLLTFVKPAVIITLPWLLYLAFNQIPNADFDPITLSGFIDNGLRVPIILNQVFAILFLGAGYWGVLWWIFAFVTLWQWRQLAQPSIFFLCLSVLLPIAAFSFLYIFSNVSYGFSGHIAVSMERLVTHIVPIAWFYIAAQSQPLARWLQETIQVRQAKTQARSSRRRA